MTDLFSFKDYRLYLKNWLAEKKQTSSFSLVKFSEAVGVHVAYMSQVLKQKQNLSPEQAFAVIEFLQLTNEERDYFFNLVMFERAGSASLKKFYRKQINDLVASRNLLSQRFKKTNELSEEATAKLFSSAFITAVQVATGFEGGVTLKDLEEKLNRSPKRIAEALEFLQQIGLCRRKGDRFYLTELHVHLPHNSVHLTKHHSNWRVESMTAIESRQDTELFFTAPVSISQDDFLSLREEMNKFILQFVETAKKSKASDVYCLNIDFFKYSRN